jgi:hypothetical protein
MAVAWTTVLIVAFLLPGVFFFAGLWSRERIPRDIVRASAIGEIGAAVFVALLINLAAGYVLFGWIGYHPTKFLIPFFIQHNIPVFLLFPHLFLPFRLLSYMFLALPC